MQTALLILHIIICLLLGLVVLIQSGKGGGLSGIMGGGGGDAVFSAPSGSMFIRKLTIGLTVAFFMVTLSLTYISARRGLRTVTRPLPPGQAAPAPSRPPETPPAASQPADIVPVPGTKSNE